MSFVIEKKLKNVVALYYLMKLDKKIPSPWLTKERIARYHAQSLCFLVITWIKSGMSMPAKEMSDIYNYMIRNSIADIIGDN